MLSIELLRSNPDLVRRGAQRRGESVPVDQILELDGRRRQIIPEADGLRARRKQVSRDLGKTKERPPALIEEMRGIGGRIKDMEDQTREIDGEIAALMLTIPNLPGDDVPDGAGEADNVVVRSMGAPPSFAFEALPHWDLAEKLDIIDFKRGAKLAGTRFYVLKGKGAKLQRALAAWMLDRHVETEGYQELYVPYLVSHESAMASGQLPKFADTMYHDDEDDLWLVPTAEVPLTNLFRDEILPPGTLPLYYVSQTPCFRRERAAAGRDTRGIKRVHQFEKVEMYKFVEPSASESELQSLLDNAEDVCSSLGMSHRVLQLCTGDLGFNSAKSYDVELWAAGSNEWLEVSSCSNCTDFQARRANVRFRPEQGGRPQYVHTLNGSGLALPRVVIAVLENFQQEDGSVVVPEILRPYTGFDTIGPPD